MDKELKSLNDELAAVKLMNLGKCCLKQQLSSIAVDMNMLDSQSRRDNLIFYGVVGDEKWRDSEEKNRNIIRNQLELNPDDMEFERVHRLNKGTNPPIIAKFSRYKQKELVFKEAYNLKDSGISISHEYTKSVRAKRKHLLPFLHNAKNDGKQCKLVFDHLIIDGTRFDVDDENPSPQSFTKKIGCWSRPCKLAIYGAPEQPSISNNLSCLLWNIVGLNSKLWDHSFVEYVQMFDIIFCVETWADDGDTFCIPGFQSFNKTRKRRYNVGRSSGGISVFVKGNLSFKVEILNPQDVSENILWLRLFDASNNQSVIFGIVYKTPANSSYAGEPIFDILEQTILDIESRFSLSKNFIVGDLNCRTGNLADFIIDDDYIPDLEQVSSDRINTTRISEDNGIKCRW